MSLSLQNRPVTAVILLILVLGAFRLVLFFDAYQHNPGLIVDPDTLSYQHLSESLYDRGVYERVEGLPEAHRPPLYPAFLALNYALFGKSNLLAPVLLQQGMVILIALMTAYLAFSLGGPVAAWIAPLLYLTEFTSFYYANEILSETLFAFLLTIAVTMLAVGFQRNSQSNTWICATGLILTAAVFVRPVGLLLIYPMTGLLCLAVYWRARSVQSALKSGLLFIAPWIVFGGAWYARNYGLSGEIFFTNYEGEALFRRLRPVIMSATQVDLQSASEFISGFAADGLKPVEIYFQILITHPVTFLTETLTDIGRVLLSPGQWHLSYYFRETFADPFPMEAFLLSGKLGPVVEGAGARPLLYSGLIGVVLLHLLVLYVGNIASVFFLRRMKEEQVILFLFLALMCLYFIGITAGFIGQPRFRVPFVPFLSVLAASGFGCLIKAMRTHPPRVL